MEDVERRGTEGRLKQDGGVVVPGSRTHPLVGPLSGLVIRSGMDLLKATNIRLPASKLEEQFSPFGGVGDTPYIECQNPKRMHNHQKKSDNTKQEGTRSVRGIKGIGRSENEGRDERPVLNGDESAGTRQARVPVLVKERLTTDSTG